ncbi:WD40 repeat domain-containing protein [bacterium]|nr:WD40 repeat domain-containing protein [bacterium]
MIQHNGPISGVACSKSYVATAGYDNQVILWEASGRTPISRGLHDHLANRCEISPDERYLVSASSDYTARIWKLPEMRLITVLDGHTDDVESARFSPDGSKVATVSQDGKVRVFEKSGALLKEFCGHVGCTQSVAWSADGSRVISSGDDGTIRTWNLSLGREERRVQPEEVQTDAVLLAPSGVVFAGNDKGDVIRMEGDRVFRLRVHSSGVKNLCMNKEGTAIVSVSYDRKLVLIDVQKDLSVIKEMTLPSQAWARACAFLNEDTLVFGTFGSSYALLRLTTGEWDLSFIENTSCLNALHVEKDQVFSVGDAGVVRKGSHGSNPRIETREVVSEMGSLCNFLTKYNGRLICGGHLGKVFDAQTGREILSLQSPINKAIQAGPYLVLATYTGKLAICEESNGGSLKLVGEFKVLENAVKDLAIDGSLVFCAGAASDLALFDLKSLKRIGHRSGAHDNIINSCVSLGDQSFATVSRDLKLKIWKSLEEIVNLSTPFDHSIKCAAVSEDRRYIGAAAYDGRFSVFDRQAGSWSLLKRLSSSGISSLEFSEGSFFASSYDGWIYKVSLL